MQKESILIYWGDFQTKTFEVTMKSYLVSRLYASIYIHSGLRHRHTETLRNFVYFAWVSSLSQMTLGSTQCSDDRGTVTTQEQFILFSF